MAGLNRVVLIGRLVKAPELKKTASGTAVTSFTVAVDNNVAKGADRTTSFIPCTCWNKVAENVAKYCSKGLLVGVEGRLTQRSYEDKSGVKRNVIEVVADNVQFLERKGATSDAADYSEQPVELDNDSSSLSHEGIDASDDDLPF